MLFSLWPLTTRRRNRSVCPLQQCLHQYPSSIGRSLSAQSWIVNPVLLKPKQPNIFYQKVKLLAIYYTSSVLLFNFVSGFPFRSRNNPSNATTWTMDAIYWLGSSRAGNIIPKHHWDIYLAFWEPHPEMCQYLPRGFGLSRWAAPCPWENQLTTCEEGEESWNWTWLLGPCCLSLEGGIVEREANGWRVWQHGYIHAGGLVTA